MTDARSGAIPVQDVDLLLVDAARRHAQNARLNRCGPVHRVRLQSGAEGWMVTGAVEARAVLADVRLVGRTAAVGHRRSMPDDLRRGMNSHMLGLNPPDHTRLRTLVSGAFTRRRMERMRPRVEEMAADLVDELAGPGPVDLIERLALPLPLQVLTELFGIPAEDTATFHRWTRMITGGGQARDELVVTATEQLAYIRDLLLRKRSDPADDLLSALVAARDGDDRLSDDELTSMVFVLLTAGYETTVNLIGNTLFMLLEDRSRRRALDDDPGALGALVEEALRLESPVQIALREALEPVEVAGTVIPRGATVLVSLLAANRDPRAGSDARTTGHLGFGYGFHYCIGAPLARAEAVAAVGTVVGRHPDLRLALPARSLAWRPSPIMHGLVAMPVLLGSSSRSLDAA